MLAVQILVTSSGALSIVGSCLIIVTIYKRGRRQLQEDSLHQFLLGLSLSDAIASLAIVTGPYMVPEGALPGVPWTFGNQATCSANASFYAVGSMANAFYNCWISIHFWRITGACFCG